MDTKDNLKLSDVLQSVSDRIFPDQLGEAEVQLNSRASDGDTPLHILIWGNETKESIFLIENGADIDASGNLGETPLHVALRQSNTEVINSLIRAGAKTNIVSEFGITAIELAKQKGIGLL